MATRGLKCVATTGGVTAPRCNIDRGKKCPLPEAIILNLGIAFWWVKEVVGGVFCDVLLDKVVMLSTYSTLSLSPRSCCNSGSF